MSKLLLISNLLLGKKLVRASAPKILNSFGKFGGNPWDALRASRIWASEKPPKKSLSSILVCLLYQARTYFQNKWCGTLRECGGVKCNRTLRYEFRHGSASAPEHAGSVFLRFCCSVPPSPRHHAFCFDLAGVFSFWIWYGGGGRGRVSPKEKLTEF